MAANKNVRSGLLNEAERLERVAKRLLHKPTLKGMAERLQEASKDLRAHAANLAAQDVRIVELERQVEELLASSTATEKEGALLAAQLKEARETVAGLMAAGAALARRLDVVDSGQDVSK